MEKNYGIELSGLKKLLDQYLIKSGDTMDLENVKKGIEKIIYENNDALMKDIKQMLDERSS